MIPASEEIAIEYFNPLSEKGPTSNIGHLEPCSSFCSVIKSSRHPFSGFFYHLIYIGIDIPISSKKDPAIFTGIDILTLILRITLTNFSSRRNFATGFLIFFLFFLWSASAGLPKVTRFQYFHKNKLLYKRARIIFAPSFLLMNIFPYGCNCVILSFSDSISASTSENHRWLWKRWRSKKRIVKIRGMM